jgi:methylglutaconyl-CoA hydratase
MHVNDSIGRVLHCMRAGRQLLRELVEAITMVRRERSTRCILIRSTVPNVFCAGADLKVRHMQEHPARCQNLSDLISSLRVLMSDVHAGACRNDSAGDV